MIDTIKKTGEMLKELEGMLEDNMNILNDQITQLKDLDPEKHKLFKHLSSEINKGVIENDKVKLSKLVEHISKYGASTTK